MKSEDRFVFDTNVLVSAVLIGSSRPAEAFRKARQSGDILLHLLRSIATFCGAACRSLNESIAPSIRS
jgi:hypothetical protein